MRFVNCQYLTQKPSELQASLTEIFHFLNNQVVGNARPTKS